MTTQWAKERHTVAATRGISAGWRVPVTACGLVVRSGSDVSDVLPPTCVRCCDLLAARLAQPELRMEVARA